MMTRIARDLASHHAHGNGQLRSLSGCRSTSERMPRVAIVGAGLSGLRCADVLLQCGVQVTIFEARNRIGGRVFQHTVGRYQVDMGPNWIHGTEGNPIMKLAENTGTVLVEPEEKQLIFDSKGRAKSSKEALELGAETWATIVDAFKYSDEYHAEIDSGTSLLDYFRDKLRKKYPDEADKVRERIDEARMWGPFIGDPIDRQSLRNFFLEECLEGENVIVASTYAKILSEVARRAEHSADLRLDEEVVKIEYRKNGSDGSASVTTVRSGTNAFDEVVVTCPLGWLKRNKSQAFVPGLPQRLHRAIESISYGHLEKIYVTFPSAWWTKGALHRTEQGASSSSSDSSPSDHKAPFFFHFHHPSYHPNPASRENEYWNQSVVSLAHFPDSTAQPTLLFYMYGPCSLYMTAMIASHEEGSDSYSALLWNFLEPFITRLPGYSGTDTMCIPASIVATQWTNDPYAGHGSYSNFQVGLVNGEDDIKCMRDAGGLSDNGRGIWFAGEHTAPFVALGTTTGAYWSGEAVARRILNRYDVEDVTIVGEKSNGVVNGEGPRKTLNGFVNDGANLAGLAI